MNKLNDLNLKQAVRNVVALLMVGVFILAGCQGQSILDAVFPQADEQFGSAAFTPTAADSGSAYEIPTPTPPIFYDLVLWIPPQFDPKGTSDASVMLGDRMKEFLAQNPQVNLDVRIKAGTGPGSMSDSLMGASSVAQSVLPSIVLFSRSDLVQAVNRNLLFPIEEVSSSVDESDWYEFAQNLAIFQGSAYGLPFASNALGLIYRKDSLSTSQPAWDEAIRQLDSLVFPAGEAETMITLALYQSAGGTFDPQVPLQKLSLEALTASLEIYDRARRSGVISRGVMDYQNDDQAWEAFNSNNSDAVITWANRMFFSEEELKLALLPSLGENPFTIGTGWAWCLTEPDVQKRVYAAELVEFLSAPEFLVKWAPVSGFLPVRPSSLSGYTNEDLRSILAALLLSARLRPDRTSIEGISAEIRTAISEVVNGTNSPAQSAQDVLTRLEELQTQ